MSRAQRALVFVAGLLAATFAAGAPASAAGSRALLAPAGRCDPAGPGVAAQERGMRCLINHARRAAGVPALRKRRKLTAAAHRKAADILSCDAFSHTACGREFTYHIRRVGYAAGCFGAAENIGWGSASVGSPRSIMRSWLGSDAHRANLLNPRFREHGVGLRAGRLGGNGGAAVWVHQLGFPC
jgi:uncharacterized protein YkwD